jgi:uroporphyrin-III C-methyltransferase
MPSGKVYLVGAGPGAADLLTMRAVNILARADIVFHDALINKDILHHCPQECIFVPVGTRGGYRVEGRQARIHRMLSDAAAHYTTIVRLKGGDPCVFGRGGEEMEYLTQQGIPWEVVPGISAGIGGLSLLGLPVTHRTLSSSVTLLAGSRMSSGHFEDLPLSSPLSSAQTLVFYMSLGHVQDIAAQLLQHGMPSETATMCVSWLSYPQQTWVTAPLAQIGAEVAASSLETPVLMVVGDVVGFWQYLRHQGSGEEET